MEKLYDYLTKKYRISNTSSNYTYLIDNKKKDYDLWLHMNIQFIQQTPEYIAILTIDEITGINKLEFALSEKKDSTLFFKYISDLLISEDKCFYKIINNIIINDYHNELLNTKHLTISNAVIDNKMLLTLQHFFKNLNSINFVDCIIQKNCSFYPLESKLYFYDCQISNTKIFEYCKQELTLRHCKINKITNSTINSNKISLDRLDDTTLTNLFLYCHFPELTNLIIGTPNSLILDKNNYYKNCLNWIPYACPRLIDLFIEGKVFSFDFLYHFNKLNKAEIRSFNDSIGPYNIYTPYVVNEVERNEIIKTSNRKIEKDMDIHLAIYDKLRTIIKFLNIVGFDEEEKNIYLKKRIPTLLLNPIQYFSEKKPVYFYSFDSKNQELKLYANNDNDNDNILFDNKFYSKVKILEGKNIKMKPQIITSKPFIYHPTSIPIIFNNNGYSDQEYIDEAIQMQDMFILDDNNNSQKIKTLH